MPAPPDCPALTSASFFSSKVNILSDITRPLIISPGNDGWPWPKPCLPALAWALHSPRSPITLSFLDCSDYPSGAASRRHSQSSVQVVRVPRGCGCAETKQSPRPRASKWNLLRANQSQSNGSELGEEEGWRAGLGTFSGGAEPQ